MKIARPCLCATAHSAIQKDKVWLLGWNCRPGNFVFECETRCRLSIPSRELAASDIFSRLRINHYVVNADLAATQILAFFQSVQCDLTGIAGSMARSRIAPSLRKRGLCSWTGGVTLCCA